MRVKYTDSAKYNAKDLGREMTKEECKLWFEFLKEYPIKILRQKPIENYILDFYCRRAKFAIELDGSQHKDLDKAKYDEKRTNVLNNYGIEVFRIDNKELKDNFYNICVYIDSKIKERLDK